MKVSLLAVAVLATIAISSAVDEECVQRKLRGLPLHWPNPSDCGSFYRCTNKSVKRHILCPAGKEYNIKSGRCGPMGKNLCVLSLSLALNEALNPCTNVLSGSYVADAKNCRNFYICDNNSAYPQSCDAGSYFDDIKEACIPDTKSQCWENLCLDQENGVYLANENDCYSFYICYNKVPVAQECSSDSYFNKESMNCLPGVCPPDAPTASTTTTATQTSTASSERPEDSTTTTTTYTSTPIITTTPRDTDETTTTSKIENTTSTHSSEVTTTPEVTTPCDDDTTTPKVTTPCDVDTTTPEVTTPCDDDTTTPKVTTPCDDDTTTSPDDDTTTPPNETCAKTNCDQAKCVNAADLTLFAALNGNSKLFCMCINNEAVCRECPEGSEFLPIHKVCYATQETTSAEDDTTTCATSPSTVDDTTTTACTEVNTTLKVTTPCEDESCSKCDTDLCQNADDYSSFPLPDTNTAYCVCIDKKPEYRECAEGTTYNTVLGIFTSETKQPMPIKCKGDIDDGDFVPNPNDCMLFFICSDGELVESTCGTGNFFNANIKSCTLDTEGICSESSNDQLPKSRSKRSVTETQSENDDCCPGGYHNGDVIPHPTDCDKKMVCYNGELKEESCGKGFYFNAALKECVKDANNVCWPATPPECVEGQVETHPSKCSMYMACCHGVLVEKSCDHGYYFNPSEKECVKDTNNICWPNDKPTCEGGFEEGQLVPNPANCSSYFKCFNGELKLQYCDHGYYYSTAKHNCVEDVDNICWPDEIPTCRGGIKEGAKIENPADCASYLICSHGQLHEVQCGKNMFYDKVEGDCQPDTTNTCWPKRPTCEEGVEEGEKVPNSADCASYLICSNGELKVVSCGHGMMYNSKKGQCEPDTKNVCWPKEPTCEGGVEEGEKVPNPNNCSSYLKCCHGDFIEEPCGNGMLFNSTLSRCVTDVNNECWSKEPTCEGGVEEGEKVSNPDDCASYLTCSNGELKIVSCDNGMMYNSKNAQCEPDTKNVCWPKEPTCEGGVEEGEKVPNPNNCSSYLKCCHGDLIEESCGNGMLFNSTLSKCVTDVNNVCWSKEPTCNGGVEEGKKVQNPADCASYLICSNGELNVVSCGHGMMYNSKKGQCEPDTKNVCWPKEPTCEGGVEEGEKVSNPDDCASYLTCSNGELKIVSCGNGMMYNSKKAQCEPDTKYVCWPKEPTCEGGVEEGEKVPNPNNCSSYLKCCHGDLIEESCGNGMLFNSTLSKCVTDVNNVCWSKEPTCKGGVEEGETVQNPGDCASYLICSNGELNVVSCGHGMMYNSKKGQCEPDTKNVCWPKEPTCEGGVEEGEKVSNPDDCASYLTCSNGELKIVFCGNGMMYNSKKGECEPDTKNVCWPKEPTCEGGVEEGEKVPNPNNCSSYLKCCHGDLIEESCGNGMLFNSTLSKCVTDVNNVCWSKEPTCKGGVEEGETVQNPGDCASYLICSNGELNVVSCGHGMMYNSKKGQCEPDTKNVCWPKEPTCEGGVEEGEKVSNPDDCASYLTCSNGELKIVFCGNGMMYNSKKGECEPDTKNVCWPKEPTCEGGVEEGEKVPNPNNCSSYLKCCHGDLIEESCGNGMLFNSTLSKCVTDVNNVCWSKEPTCKGGVEEGEKVQNPGDCASYLICSNGELNIVSCGHGMMYNSEKGQCEQDTKNVCWPKEPTCEGGVEEGEKVSNPDDCASYLTCSNGELKIVSCGNGMMYNSKKAQCEPDTKYVCWPKEPTCEGGVEEGEKVPNPNNCSSYLKCCHGDLIEESCGNGMLFNSTLSKCVTDVNNVCWSKEPTCKGGVEEGETVQNPGDCASYLICSNGELNVVSCGHGMMYNSKKGQCEPDTKNVCWPKEPTCEGGVEEGEKVSNPDDCASYLTCSNGELKIVFCGNGMMYNSKKGECEPDTKNVCWPKEPTCEGGVEEGEKVPNPNNCSSYLKCCHGDLIEESCGNGMLFNSTLSKCVTDVNNVCWSKEPTCKGGVEEGEKVQNPGDCASYLICSNGELNVVSCGHGMMYNSEKGQCEQDTKNVCWPKEPTCEGGVEEGEKVSNPDDCASYLTCSNGELKIVFCGNGMMYNSKKGECEPDTKNVCWPKEPTCEGGVEEGEKVPNPNNCSSYLKCCHGDLIEESCGNGMLFNSTLSKCVTDVNNVCWSKEPTCKGGVEEGETVQNPGDCASYLICSNGELNVVSCGHGMMYNSKKGQCEPDTKNVCWPKEPTCEGGVEEGEKVSNPDDCASYLTCSNGELKIVSCGNGMMYNSEKSQCEQDTKNVCWPKEPTCEGGVEEGEKVPNPNNCSSYLKCCHGDLIEESCGNGMLFNSTLSSCVTDVNNVCWSKEPTCKGGVDEGEKVKNPGDCASYLICSNGELKVVSCGHGMMYNSEKGQCEQDTKNVCWPKEPTCEGGVEEGEKISNPNNCSSYLKCCHGDLIEESCGNGMLFNSTLSSCVTDVNNVCWSKEPTCKGGVEEGEKVQNPGDCASYLICSNGELNVVSCGHGMMYNSDKGQCEQDTKNVCWPKEPTCEGGVEEGEKVPNPNNCSSYLKCCHGDLIEESCGNGMLFNSTLSSCVTDINNVCWPKEQTCEGGVEEGDKVQNPADCASYLICSNGELKVVSCGKGMLYNSKIGQCEADTNNVCWPKEPACENGIEEGQKVSNPSNCSAYLICCHGVLTEEFCGSGMLFDSKTNQCQKDEDNMCWPKDMCEEGQQVQNPANCSSYFSCCGGKLNLEFCDEGFYFNPDLKKCSFDINNICWPQEASCNCEGKTEAIEAECDKMLVCTNGQWQVESCGKGYFFNNVTMKCQPDTEHICWPQKPCTCSGGYEEGDTSPADDCDKYYTCSGGVQVLGECGINMYYNATCGTCDPDTEHKCWLNYCADQPNGVMIPNPKQCNAFYLCNNGESTDEVCETGQWFDPTQSSCQPDMEAECYNPCACQDQIKMLPHPDCTKFYFCNGNQTIVETCPVGGFDATIGDCNPQKKCSDNGCEGKQDYFTYADIQDKTKFYLCLNGVPVLKNCLPNTEYNGAVCAHVSDPDCDPTPCSSQEYLTPYATLNDTEETAFCICRKGYATKQYCAAGYVFSPEMEACYSDAPCDPMMCNFCPDYFVFANRDDTKSFCLCADKHAVIVPCPNGGTFNSYQMACSNVEISTQCDQLECVNRDDYYTYPDSSGSTKGFCMCKDHVGTFNNCSEKSYFDATMGACRLNNIQCDSSKCKGLANNTKVGALISSQGFCECVSGEATYYNCKNNAEFDAASQECIDPLCDPTKCEKAADYTQFPAVGSTHGFCMCYSKEVVYKSCDEGGIFNAAMLVCQMPLKNCVDSKCVGVADNTKLPADYSIYGYCSCTGGKATFQECQNGLVFDPTSQSCKTENLPIEDVCDTTYCDDTAHAGQIYPSINTIYGYCQCSDSVPSFHPCPNGETFDSTLMTCHPTVSSKCDLSLCSEASPNNGYPIPTKTGNNSFCYCTGPGNAMLINCPTDLYYNDNQKKCVATIEEGCSCPGGLQNGDVAPDTNDCSQYYICNSGTMHQQACPSGQYFNTECNKCQDDTTGMCVKKEACSCLGTYREGERLMHPYNEQMYYVCENKMLQERNCGTGRIFNKGINQCMRAPRTNSRHIQKRSVDVDEFYCVEDQKRSVPSNCSQYEVCLNSTWKLQSCSPFNYYNPEQMQCLEPRDDAVCVYAKVTNLPKCDEAMEKQLYKGRTCQQYFRCQKGKWRLNSCPKYQYYNFRIASCLPHHFGEKFECNYLGNNTEIEHSPNTCQDLSMRPYAPNCDMYLMCSGNYWWYNYCPLGMYFNRTLNFCLPDVGNVCPAAVKNSQIMNTTNNDDLPDELCQHEGFLRPSALACNRYYICIGGQWKQQTCGNHNYYDAQLNQCSPDTEGFCQQLKADCLPEQKRLSPANCSAYEKCSLDGKWLHWDCPQGKIYDNLLQQCVANDGSCSNAGLRKVCNPQETRKVANNCTQFYYCDEEQWAIASCLKGSMYWPEKQMCVSYSRADKCKPLVRNPLVDDNRKDTNSCVGQLNGVFIAHLWDCTRYYICVNETPSQEMQCASGSFFDTSLEYCRPNDGSCRLPLKGECGNATEDSLVSHTTDCQSYYLCSSVNGQQLMHCPVGQYYHNYERQCRVDHGECKRPSNTAFNFTAKCFNETHGTRLAHEQYCNIYYICVKGLAVAIECPDNYQFSALLNQCVYDQDHVCHGGKLVDSNLNYSCGNLSDGSYIADRQDCTRYYICSAGQAQPKKCSGSTYFDAKQLLCVPDDGSCPFIGIDEPSQNPVPPDPSVCEGRHGNLMPDPVNCNNFYVCVNSKLRHDRCYPQFFFNTTLNQCQQKSMLNDTLDVETKTAVGAETLEKAIAIQNRECSINRTSIEIMCKEYGEGATMAEQGDCRLYVTCEEEGAASSQRCRNGESYDSLFGFCRQTDGTCQMDSGQRAGECSGRHGQLARDTNNCRKYFICINGQKITQSCAEDEYFSKSQNICTKDTLNTCAPEPAAEELAWQPQSCNGLSESILYPYIHDNCRSYFQCVKGVVKIQHCADKLFFDPTTVKCVQNQTECVMPTKSEQRSPLFAKQNYEKLCTQRDMEQPYANFENNCRSFYTCHADGDVSHELCPLGMAFDKNHARCMAEKNVICN